jgi:hypothetical protein
MRGLVGADVRFLDREHLEEFQILAISGIQERLHRWLY